jgi:hypothetical protein
MQKPFMLHSPLSHTIATLQMPRNPNSEMEKTPTTMQLVMQRVQGKPSKLLVHASPKLLENGVHTSKKSATSLKLNTMNTSLTD